MKILEERLDTLERIIKKPSFRESRGLGNEVGYYIFDYPAEDELRVRERIKYLKNRNDDGTEDFVIQVFDLYDIMTEILQSKGYMEKCYAMEKKKGFYKVSTAVANLMRVNATDGLIVEYIKERIKDNGIVFITGIGKCYPIIRSHTILNNLHLVIDRVPVVMFYPGRYDGQELILFDEIKDDNYYRAFRLADI